MGRPPFVGRSREIDRAVAIVGSDDAATLALFGPPGIGKSALLDAVRRRLEAAGLRVERVVASRAGAALPLTPFSRFIAMDGTSADDLGTSVARVTEAVRAVGQRAPTVLMVDDAHDLDDASVVVVSQLAHGGEVRVVLVARSSEPMPPDLEHLLDGPGVDCVEVRPLSREETDELVRQDLQRRERGTLAGRAAVSPQVLDALWRTSEGVPLHVCDLLDNSVRSGALAIDGDSRWVQREPILPSTRFADALSRRVERLGDGCVTLVRVLAVTGPLPLHVADAIASTRDRLAAERAGLLRRRSEEPMSDTVDFAHDLYRDAASTWMGSGERLRLAADVATLLGDARAMAPDDELLRAELSLQAGDLGTDDAAIYERGAEVACRVHYDGALALQLSEAALARGAGVRSELLRLEALGLLGRFEEANQGFARLGSSVHEPSDVAMVSSAHAWHLLLNLGDARAAVAVLDRSGDGLPAPLAKELREQRTTAQLLGRRATDAVTSGAPLLEDPSGVPPTLVSALISGLTVIGWAEDASRLAEATLERSRSGEEHHLTELSVLWDRVLARWQLGRLGELSNPFDGLVPKERPLPASPWMRTAMTATFELLRGRLDRSSALHESVWDQMLGAPPQVVAMNSVLHATAEAQLGRHRRAAELLASLEDLPEGTTTRHRWWIARARILVAAAQGALTDAAHASIELADAHAGEHLYVTTSLHDVVRFGRAKFVKERLLAQSVRPHCTWWDRICADHAVAAADDHGDPAQLLDLAERFERGGRAVDALEATAQAVTATEQDPTSSTRALGILAGARLNSLLAECGPVRTPLVVAVPRSLTEREFLVARLAASGATNAEIARRLGTSARTVGNQLQSVYQKLGVHSRDELRFLGD